MTEFLMPSLGADMDAGTLVEWRIKPGDTVKRGDVVALVETQKGIVEVEIWESGVVQALLVAPGTKVPVGTVLAALGADDQAKATAQAPPRVQASPAARQLARELGVDLAMVRATGPHGTVSRGDVEGAARATVPIAATVPVVPKAPEKPARGDSLADTAMRQAIAAAMARSKREIPHYYLATDIDVTGAARWLEAENAKRPITERALLAALLLKATALALREVPELNGLFVDGAFRISQPIHIGVAVMLRQGGLVAPALHDVDQKPVGQVMADLRDLVGRARRGTLRSSEMADPTMTVTNLGDQGVASVFGVIYPPQVALVGFGKVTQRPWAEKGMLGVRSVVTATLAADHRVSDGHRGALLLSAIDRFLSEPEKL